MTDEIMDKELILLEDQELRNEELYSDLPALTRGTSLSQYIADFGKIGGGGAGVLESNGGAGVLESNDDDVVDPLLTW